MSQIQEFQHYVPNKKIGNYVWNHQASLGKGAFGVVYFGHPQNDMKQNVAIKQMDNKKLQGQAMQKALQNELSIMKQLKGAHTCGMLAHYQTTNNQYIIQPFCNGGDLRQLLNKRQKLSEEEALRVLKHLLKGMQEMVQLDLAHRDIKPDNCLIHDNIYKIADYGFSTRMEGKLMKDKCGTPLYMSPQALQGIPYSGKNDIWGIGLIYYEMLFGKTPWNAKNMNDLVVMPRTQPLKFPVNVPISNMSKKFIQNCLQYEEEHRLSWNDIFHSEIFTTTQVMQTVHMSQDSKNVLQQFQAIYQRNNLDLKKIFDNFDKHKDQKLDSEELTKLFQVFDPNITQQQCNEILKSFDNTNDGSLDFQEFQLLIEFTDFEEHDDHMGNEMLLEIKAKKVIKDLRRVISQNQLNLRKIFDKLDKSGDGNLDFQELRVLLKNIDKKLTENEIRIVFNLFDANKDGDVNFTEFEAAIVEGQEQSQCQGVGNNSSIISQSTQRFFQKIKQTIINNELDLDMIFTHFDQDGSRSLDFEEYTQFIKVVNMKAEPQDIKDSFIALDVNNDSTIQFEEFIALLK